MAYLCIGKYAKTPYNIDNFFLNIYSAEELCYYLYENAYLLDEEIMNGRLCDFVENELELTELGRKLSGLIRAGASLCAFVSTILEDCYYCSREELKKIESSLRTNSELGIVEKRKARGDYLLGVDKYVLAIEEYNLAIYNADKESAKEFLAKTYHNLAVAYSKLFLFEIAARYFGESYQILQDEDTYASYVMAKKMSASGKENDEAEDEQSFYEDMPADYKIYVNAQNAKQEGKISEHYEILNQLITKWKQEYRKSTSIE